MSKSTKIAVLDPDPKSREWAGLLLTNNGFDVSLFATANEITEALRKSPADLVLLDLAVNEIHGTEVIRESKRNNPEVSIILTGTTETVDANPNLLMFGGFEYILKPLHGDIIQTVIQQRTHQQHIYRICSALSATLELDDALNLILNTTVQEVGAQNGAILLNNGSEGTLRIRALNGLPEDLVGSLHEMEQTSILRLVLENREPIVIQGGFANIPFMPDSQPKDIGSTIYAPIRIGGKTIGILNLNRSAASEPFLQSDLRTLEIVALQTAIAIENAQAHHYALEREKMRQELELARSLQQSLLPKSPGYERYAEISWKNVPAKMVGGDFFDFVELGPDRMGLIVGDVATKGIPGALMMVHTISSFRLRTSSEKRPGKVLEELNNDIAAHSARGMFVTLVYAVFDFQENVLTLANAGHPRPILFRSSSGRIESLDEYVGIPVGVMKDASYGSIELPLNPGDFLFLYTDGVTETRNHIKEEFSLNRLQDLLQENKVPLDSLCDQLLNELTSFNRDGSQHDDITMVAVGLRNGS